MRGLINMGKTLEGIRKLAIDAGYVIKRMSESAAVFQKEGLGNFVTEADLESEKFVVETVKNAFPDDVFLSEESHTDMKHAQGNVWVIDPIDGTTNFAYKRDFSAVSIAYAEDGVLQLAAVYNPFTDVLYSAQRGKGAFLGMNQIRIPERPAGHHLNVGTGPAYDEALSRRNLELMLKIHPLPAYRIFAAAAIELCWIASGTMDVYFHTDLKPWDNAAAFLVIEEAGGVIRSFENKPVDFTAKEIIAGSPEFVTTISRQFTT